MKEKGFTLIELLVTLSIISLLSSIVLFSFNSAMKKARDAQRKQDLNTIKMALEQYWSVYGHYPPEHFYCDSSIGASESSDCPVSSPQDYWDLNSDLQALVEEGYFGKIPVDPINNSIYYYQYEPDADTQNGCQVSCCQWELCARLESTGEKYCVRSIRTSQDYPSGL